MASMNQLTKMAVDQSCNRFQISLIRYLGLSHQQLPYFYFTCTLLGVSKKYPKYAHTKIDHKLVFISRLILQQGAPLLFNNGEYQPYGRFWVLEGEPNQLLSV
jgi:hypothetical protein